MGKIRTYNPLPKLKSPNATGAQFGAQTGQAMQGLGQSLEAVGSALKQHAEQKNISKLNADFATAQAEISVAWDETLKNADPNDDEVASRFLSEVVKPRLEMISENIKTPAGRQYYERMSAGFNAHFYEQAANGQAELAGVAAQQNFDIALNQISTALVNDPSAFSLSLTQIDETLAGSGLSTEQQLKLRNASYQTAAVSAARGLIDTNPGAAKEIISGGQFDKYIDGNAKAALLNAADNAIDADEADANRALILQSKYRAEVDRGAQQEWTMKIAEGDYDFKELANDDRLDPESKRALRGLAEAELNGENSENSVFNDALHRAYLPPSDPNRLTESQLRSMTGIDIKKPAEINALWSALDDSKSPEGQKRNEALTSLEMDARRVYIKNPMFPDPDGEAKVSQFMLFARDELDRALKAGKDWREILNPASPDYLGRQLTIASPQELMQGMLNNLHGGPRQLNLPSQVEAPERNPGETPDEYLKRIGKK